MSNLVIIPARGGSKGIPEKNMKLISGQPLIYWTIKSALQSKCVDRVIVTTDSKEIASIAESLGADVPFIRPDDLSGDKATTESAMLHCVKWLNENEGYQPRNVILLQPTSPVRMERSIDNAYAYFLKSQADSLVSVSEFSHFLWANHKEPRAMYDFMNRPRRQDISVQDIKYRENGSIYITNTEILLKEGNRLGGVICCFLMAEQEGYEIDSPLDFIVTEAVLENQIKDQSSC